MYEYNRINAKYKPIMLDALLEQKQFNFLFAEPNMGLQT
jgi:hypothetical protein